MFDNESSCVVQSLRHDSLRFSTDTDETVIEKLLCDVLKGLHELVMVSSKLQMALLISLDEASNIEAEDVGEQQQQL